MTPDFLKGLKAYPQIYKDGLDNTMISELADSALRLAVIEQAGDEEIEAAYSDAKGHTLYRLTGVEHLKNIANGERLRIAELTRERDEAVAFLIGLQKLYGFKIQPEGVPYWLWLKLEKGGAV